MDIISSVSSTCLKTFICPIVYYEQCSYFIEEYVYTILPKNESKTDWAFGTFSKYFLYNWGQCNSILHFFVGNTVVNYNILSWLWELYGLFLLKKVSWQFKHSVSCDGAGKVQYSYLGFETLKCVKVIQECEMHFCFMRNNDALIVINIMKIRIIAHEHSAHISEQ